MSWFFGAGMGLLFGGPLGAIVGGVMEHMVTKNAHDDGYSAHSAGNAQEAVFITNLAAIMTKVAMADGNISSEERRIIHNFFASRLGYRGRELRYIDGIITETERLNPDITSICRAFRQTSPLEARLLLLDITYQIALADNIISEKEQIEINLIAAQIGISQIDHNRIRYRYRQSRSGHSKHYSSTINEDHYQVLGIGRSASDSEVKQAYKQMAMQYHPDKVSHLGKELIEFANKKFKEINEAYDAIKKERNIH